MKKRKWAAAMLAACVMLAHAGARAELGFAETAKNKVNMRTSIGGKIMMRIDAPQSVYVFEEAQRGEELWCHVYTNRNKDCVDGWIRADMLRFLSEEFHDVVSVQAGSHYVTGLRGDGTVAIMGNDMPHLPCVDTVRTWRDIRQVSSWICEVYGRDAQGHIRAVGRNAGYVASACAGDVARIDGYIPVALDENGCLTEAWISQNLPGAEEWMGEIRGVPLKRALKGYLMVVLTQEGEVRCSEPEELSPQDAFDGETYVDIAYYWNDVLALRADGTVRAAGTHDEAISQTGSWRNVTMIAAGNDHMLGLKADGTVYYAGTDARHAAQVEAWTDIVDIDAGDGYSIALRGDGAVLMAGAYEKYWR